MAAAMGAAYCQLTRTALIRCLTYHPMHFSPCTLCEMSVNQRAAYPGLIPYYYEIHENHLRFYYMYVCTGCPEKSLPKKYLMKLTIYVVLS